MATEAIMNAPSSPPHPTLAFQVLANLHEGDYDLLSTEINHYIYAIRTRTGRTTLSAREARVLFNRMLDIMVLVPQVTTNEPQDLDQLKSLEEAMAEPPAQITKRRV